MQPYFVLLLIVFLHNVISSLDYDILDSDYPGNVWGQCVERHDEEFCDVIEDECLKAFAIEAPKEPNRANRKYEPSVSECIKRDGLFGMCERYHGQADCLKMESECTKQLNAPPPQNSRKAYKMYQHVAKCVLAQDLWSRCIININAYRCAKLRDNCKIFAGESRISFGARKLDSFSPKVSECMYNQVEFTVEH